MDPYYALSSPLSSQTVEVVANILRILCAVSWNTCYIAMVYRSFQDKTYSNAIIPLCNNLAWEFVYGIFYCPNIFFMRVMNLGWFILNLGVIYAAIKFSRNEWKHAPLVERNLPLIFAIGIIGLTAGHFALAAQLGPHISFIWSAKGCQLVLSTGAVSQLLARGSTRGGSYTIWLSRYLGTFFIDIMVILRYVYRAQGSSWPTSPLLLWFMAVFHLMDVTYGVLYYRIRQSELHNRDEMQKNQ